MLRVEIPEDKTKLQPQVEALQYLLEHDTSEKDREIHLEALSVLKVRLRELESK